MRRGLVGGERPDLEPVPAARTRWVWLLLLPLACSATMPQSLAQSARVVQGTVESANDQAQPDAVVYLQDQKNLEVKTYITEADGHCLLYTSRCV